MSSLTIQFPYRAIQQLGRAVNNARSKAGSLLTSVTQPVTTAVNQAAAKRFAKVFHDIQENAWDTINKKIVPITVVSGALYSGSIGLCGGMVSAGVLAFHICAAQTLSISSTVLCTTGCAFIGAVGGFAVGAASGALITWCGVLAVQKILTPSLLEEWEMPNTEDGEQFTTPRVEQSGGTRPATPAAPAPPDGGLGDDWQHVDRPDADRGAEHA